MRLSFRRMLLLLGVVLFALPVTAQYNHSSPSPRYRDHFRSNRSAGDVLEVELRDPGTLEREISPEMFKRVRLLRVAGPFNNDDAKTVKKLCQRSKVYDEGGRSVNNYLDLDLEYARLMDKGLFSSRYSETEGVPSGMFSSMSKLRSVVLPERVRTIGNGAFRNCYDLEDVYIPPRLRSIGDGAFSDCSSLTHVDWPDAIESIGEEAFKGCSKLTDITLPSRLRSLGKRALANLPISVLILPQSLEEMGQDALTGTSLRRLAIPPALKIADNRPGTMKKLEEIVVSPDNPYYSVVAGALYDADERTLLLYPLGMGGAYSVAPGTQAIAAHAFSGASKLSRVSLPQSVGTMGANTFENCSSLVEADLGAAELSSLPEGAFSQCKALQNMILPGAIEVIGTRAFDECSSLQSINLPDGLRTIDQRAFRKCKGLIEVHLPSSVATLGENVFEDCTSLAAVTLSSVSSVPKGAFTGCKALRSVDVPQGVLTLGEKSFYHCTSLLQATLPPSCTRIGKEAFRGCTSLQGIEVPGSVVEIDKEAFRECKSLATITLQEGVRQIGDNAFRDAVVTSITFPSTVTAFGKKVLENCKHLTRIVCLSPTPPALDKASNERVPLYVPATALSMYKDAKNWKKFKSIQSADN